MVLTRTIKVQLVAFVAVSLIAGLVMLISFIRLPALLFGIGHYDVTVELPDASGLYERSNVTYRGTEVGQVKSVHLTGHGAEAVMSLRSDTKIPSDLDAQVHSQTAIGEQYIALLPRNGSSAPLRNGDVIPLDRTTVPPDISSLLDATNRGLKAIPKDNLKTVVDESYTAVGGLGPDLSRLIKGSTGLAIDAHANLDELTTLIDSAKPVLDSQTDTSHSVQAWAANLADITGQLKANDSAVQGVLQKGPGAADEGRRLFDRLQPTLPVVLANLVSVGEAAVIYRDNLEQLLVLLPQGAATMQAIAVPNRDTKQAYRGAFLSFNLNLNLPPTCTTGFMPPQQQRAQSDVDYPPRPAGDLYCRVPQDAMFNVRGARNTPCVTVPGKRAPTVKMCESNENYVPLNDGFNWKGDPNATLSGQSIPQPPPGTPGSTAPPPKGPAPPPLAAAEYDPATGTYVGPDWHVYTQSDLARGPGKEQTWQSMMTPPGS
jgi:phospholipid/cholesterol/gamma-HCH transport system substrate-binding protein